MRRTKRRRSQKLALSGILGLLCAELHVGILKTMQFQELRDSGAQKTRRRKSQKWTFRNSGAPVCRTRRRKSQQMDFQDFWDSCALNKTSEISKNALSGIPGLLCAEQDVGNINKCTFRNSGTPVRRARRRKSQKWTFRDSGTPVRRTRRRNYQQMHFQEFWDSCAQNRTSEISKNALSEILGLLCAEQNVGNLKLMRVQNIWGLLCAEQNVGNLNTYFTVIRV